MGSSATLNDPYLGHLKQYMRNIFPECVGSVTVPANNANYYTVTFSRILGPFRCAHLEHILSLEDEKILEAVFRFPDLPVSDSGLSIEFTVRQPYARLDESHFAQYIYRHRNNINLSREAISPILADIAHTPADERVDYTNLQAILTKFHNCEETIPLVKVAISANPAAGGYTAILRNLAQIRLSFLEYCLANYRGLLEDFALEANDSTDRRLELAIRSVSSSLPTAFPRLERTQASQRRTSKRKEAPIVSAATGKTSRHKT